MNRRRLLARFALAPSVLRTYACFWSHDIESWIRMQIFAFQSHSTVHIVFTMMTPPFFTRTRWLYLPLLLSCIVFLANAWSAAEPRIVHGQRCLYVPCPTTTSNNNNPLPMVLIGGLGQTISSYIPHLPTLAKDRSVLVYECRGQGRMEPPEPEDYYNNVTIPFQAERLLETINTVLGEECKFHLVGFSLGARVAMAAACLDSDNRIQGLVLTGVATQPSLEAKVAMFAWKQLLRR